MDRSGMAGDTHSNMTTLLTFATRQVKCSDCKIWEVLEARAQEIRVMNGTFVAHIYCTCVWFSCMYLSTNIIIFICMYVVMYRVVLTASRQPPCVRVDHVEYQPLNTPQRIELEANSGKASSLHQGSIACLGPDKDVWCPFLLCWHFNFFYVLVSYASPQILK